MQRNIQKKRHDLLQELASKSDGSAVASAVTRSAVKDATETEAAASKTEQNEEEAWRDVASPTQVRARPNDETENAVSIVDAQNSAADLVSALNNNDNLADALSKQFTSISAEHTKYQMSPNCFLDFVYQDERIAFASDVDPEVAAADEKIARDAAAFLYSVMLPAITNEVCVMCT